jgi:hypothetical protein
LSLIDEIAQKSRLMPRCEKVKFLSSLANFNEVFLREALDAANRIQDFLEQARFFQKLSLIEDALVAARKIIREDEKIDFLISLSEEDSGILEGIIESFDMLQSDYQKSKILIRLLDCQSIDFKKKLEMANSIVSFASKAEFYIAALNSYPELIHYALEFSGKVEYDDERAKLLIKLAKISPESSEKILSLIGEMRISRVIEIVSTLATVIPKFWMLLFELLNQARTNCPSELQFVLGKVVDQHPQSYRLILPYLTFVAQGTQASILLSLSKYFPEFREMALQVTRTMNNDDDLYWKASLLAEFGESQLQECLELSRLIPSDFYLVQQLHNLKKCLSDDLLGEAFGLMDIVTHKPTRAEALSSYLPRLPLHNLPYPDWQSHLHLLAHRTRADLMGDLVTLYPAILHLGGEGAMRGVVDEMKRVCEQWP